MLERKTYRVQAHWSCPAALCQGIIPLSCWLQCHFLTLLGKCPAIYAKCHAAVPPHDKLAVVWFRYRFPNTCIKAQEIPLCSRKGSGLPSEVSSSNTTALFQFQDYNWLVDPDLKCSWFESYSEDLFFFLPLVSNSSCSVRHLCRSHAFPSWPISF